MPIVLDYDDVIFDTFKKLIKFYNKAYREWFRKEHFIHADFKKVWRITREESSARFREFFKSTESASIIPYPGSRDFIRRLAMRHELHIATNRPEEARKETIQLLDRYFKGMFTDVHFCTRDWGLDHFRKKSSVCREVMANIILEDHPENVIDCAMDGRHVISSRPAME
ncbi:MAG: hypothetical protein FJZ43_00995 [Candidatus Staskawiczbacteria bacterium]|nr:hypothetical protein [Candidatus Staskawiczbacteria bacterium]